MYMPRPVSKSYWDRVLKPSEDFNHYYLALEDSAHRHRYVAQGECSLNEAKNAAISALTNDNDLLAAYVYPPYCPICDPNPHCDEPHRHTLEPATHLDYLAVYVRSGKSIVKG